MNQSTWKTYTIPFTYHERIQPPRGAPIPIYTRGGQRVTHKTNPEWFYPPQSHKVTFQAKELSKVTFQKGEEWSDTNRKYNLSIKAKGLRRVEAPKEVSAIFKLVTIKPEPREKQ